MFCITFLKNYKRKNKKLWGYITERYSEPCQTCKFDLFEKQLTANGSRLQMIMDPELWRHKL